VIILDCETTGLDPNEDLMLEIALLHVTDDLTRVLSRFDSLIRFDFAWWGGQINSRKTGEPHPAHVVMEMHQKSGLWDELEFTKHSAPHLRTVEESIFTWLDDQESRFGIEVAQEPLVGSTISFDRSFLKVHMPDVEKRFHYRNIDVSSVKELTRRWRAPVYAHLPESRKIHRAVPDCYDTLNELLFYKQRVLDLLSTPYTPFKHEWPET